MGKTWKLLVVGVTVEIGNKNAFLIVKEVDVQLRFKFPADLGSYCLKKITIRASPTIFLSKKREKECIPYHLTKMLLAMSFSYSSGESSGARFFPKHCRVNRLCR
jgi:hypothetical protein